MIGPDTFQREMEVVAGRRLIGELRGQPRKLVLEPTETAFGPDSTGRQLSGVVETR